MINWFKYFGQKLDNFYAYAKMCPSEQNVSTPTFYVLLPGKGKAIFLTPLYHLLLLHRHLDIFWEITAHMPAANSNRKPLVPSQSC